MISLAISLSLSDSAECYCGLCESTFYFLLDELILLCDHLPIALCWSTRISIVVVQIITILKLRERVLRLSDTIVLFSHTYRAILIVRFPLLAIVKAGLGILIRFLSKQIFFCSLHLRHYAAFRAAEYISSTPYPPSPEIFFLSP